MRAASIDIGTNSTRLLVAEDIDTEIKVLESILITTRIGEGMGPEKILKEVPINRTVKALKSFYDICDKFKVEKVIVAATSAVRDASNQEIFTDIVKSELGWDVRVLAGEEEALFSYLGVIRGLRANISKPAIIDIGGGSTEFIWNTGITESISVNAGAVRMTEGNHSIDEVLEVLKPALKKLVAFRPSNLIGVGGTVTTLAAIDQELKTYDSTKIHGYKINRDKINEVLKMISGLTLEQKKKVPGLQPERADIIIAGITILKLILDELNINELIVSETDILYGLLLKG